MWISWSALTKPMCSVAVPLFAVTLVGATPLITQQPLEQVRQASYAYIPMAAIDTSSDAVGIAESSLYFMTPAELDTALDIMQSMGVTQLRMFVPWRAVEPAEGTYDWASVDRVVNAAAERDLAVLAVVTSTPTWASDVTTSAYGAPRDPADYGTFMGQLAQRYGAGTGDPETARISAYEVWNEPQNAVFWAPKPDPAAYTELLKSAYTAIKAVDPSGTVVGGVVTAGLTWGDVNISPVEYVQRMYAAGAAGYFDALSYHPYNYNTTLSAGKSSPVSAYSQLQQMQALMAQNGDGAKQVWTSEYGVPTTGAYTEAQQAAYIKDFMNTWSSTAGTGPMFMYSLVDQETGTTDREDNFGLYHDDWTPKPAAEVVRDWIESHGGALPPVAEPPAPPVVTPTVPTPEPPASTSLSAAAQQANANLRAAATNFNNALKAAAAKWAASMKNSATTTTTTTTTATVAAPDAAAARTAVPDSTETERSASAESSTAKDDSRPVTKSPTLERRAERSSDADTTKRQAARDARKQQVEANSGAGEGRRGSR